MAERWWQDVEEDPIHEEAAQWLARLENPQVSLEETLSWQQWMQKDQRHVQAFERMEATALTVRGMPRPETGDLSQSRRWAPGLALAASIVVAAIAAAWLWQNPGVLPAGFGPADVVQTAVGENRSLRLADGSRVTLGGGTQLRVRFGGESRHIELTRGEAFFVVAQETTRPFTVDAGDAVVRAVGTEFNVRRGQDRVVVAVVEGRVMVEPAAPKSANILPWAAVRLDAGQQTIIDGEGVETATRLSNLETATTWRAGRLTFRGEPLRHVVEDVNRYAAKPVTIGEPSIGELRFTGTVLNDNVGGWIASLQSVFGIEAIEEPERIVLRLR